MTGNNRSSGDARNASNGDHLSDDQLNLLVDGDLSTDEISGMRAHLSICAECQQNYDDLLVMRDLLRSLPQSPTPRSFQLSPEMAGQKSTPPGGFTAWLLGALPVL